MTGQIPRRADVVVVGAGLSGLTAARRLLDTGVTSVVVLEAKDRVGGRTLTEPAGHDGVAVDAGATLAYPTHHEVLRLAEEVGVTAFPSYVDGKFVYHSRGRSHTFAWTGLRGARVLGARPLMPLWRALLPLAGRWLDLPVEPAALVELMRVINRLDRLARKVPKDAPWAAPGSEGLDRQSLAAWLAAEVRSAQARTLFELFFGYLPPTASFLHALHFLNTWGGIGDLLTGQAEILRFTGGAQALSAKLAGSLGGRVILGAPVTRIDRSPSTVTVHAGGARLEAGRVIVALTPSGCRDIRFTPELPSGRRTLQDSWANVHGIKINVIYDEPFWRDQGLSGSGFTDLAAAPGVADTSPPDGSVGILSSYLTAAQDAAPAAVLDAYATLFGPRAREPIRFLAKNWTHEPYTFGCEGGLLPGALTTARTLLRQPVDRVHWAGVETADRWMGFMNGAVIAGDRAAREVLAS